MNCIYSTKNEGNYFTGYYDKNVFKNGILLCHKINGDLKSLPKKNDVAEIGYFNLKTEKWSKLDETTAWNWQQGSNLSFIGKGNKIGFNIRNKNSDEVGFKILDLSGNELNYFSRPVAAYSFSSEFYLATNLSLLTSIRPSYSYAGYESNDSELVDKLIKVNIDTGEETILVDKHALRKYFDISKGVITIEHPMISPDDSKVMFLARQRYNNKQISYLFIVEVLTRELSFYNKLHRISHCCWADSNTVIGFGNLGTGLNSSKVSTVLSLFTPVWLRSIIKIIFFQKPNEKFRFVTDGYFSLKYNAGKIEYIKVLEGLPDGHPNVVELNEKELEIVTDTYPDNIGTAYIYRAVLNKENINMGSELTELSIKTDLDFSNTGYRCDLHPKVNDGFCVIDLAVDGKRLVKVYEL